MLQMDVRYKNIQSSAYTISILFGGIFIADVRHRVLISIIYIIPLINLKYNKRCRDVFIEQRNK